jgi:hypothetical protein
VDFFYIVVVRVNSPTTKCKLRHLKSIDCLYRLDLYKGLLEPWPDIKRISTITVKPTEMANVKYSAELAQCWVEAVSGVY